MASELSHYLSLDLTAEIALIDAGQSADVDVHVVDARPQPDAALTSGDDGELAWNNTRSCVRTQRHVIQHRRSQFAVTFSVDAVMSGDRVGALANRPRPTDGKKRFQGLREILSELLIKSALKGDMDVVSHLVNCQSVHVDVADRTGNTALHSASVSNSRSTLYRFFTAGCYA